MKLLDGMGWIDQFIEKSGTALEPHEKYLLGNYMAKRAKIMQDETKDELKEYYNQFGELPTGWECKLSTRTKYNFEEITEYLLLTNSVKEFEKKIKIASDAKLKGNTIMGEDGKPAPTVSMEFTEIYTVSHK